MTIVKNLKKVMPVFHVIAALLVYCKPLEHLANIGITHSLTAARNWLWVVVPSTLTGRQQEPMHRQQ